MEDKKNNFSAAVIISRSFHLFSKYKIKMYNGME